MTEIQITEKDILNFDPNEQFVDTVPEPTLNKDFSNCIIVENVPIVSAAKAPKLKSVLERLFRKIDTIISIYVPTNDKGETLGFCFIEYPTKEIALKAIKQYNGFDIDKIQKLKFKISLCTEIEKYMKGTLEYKEYVPPKYVERPNLLSWLQDDKFRDQYVVRYWDITKVLWNDAQKGAVSIAERKAWSEDMVQWSTYGSYLATFHSKGIALWGGEQFKECGRFLHRNAKLIDFSPRETYLVTWNEDKKDNLIFWNVISGEKMKSITVPLKPEDVVKSWPLFKWSHDERYFARLGVDCIHVYETINFGLIGKRPISIPGVAGFCWSPTDNIISYWVPEMGPTPAKIALLELPGRKEIRSKNFYGVSSVKMDWNPSGKFVCFRVDVTTKKKTHLNTSFNIMRVKQRNVPIDVLDLSEKVVDFAWEPKGNRFAVISGDGPKPNVYIYNITSKQVKLYDKLEKKSVNRLYWSPKGQFLVMANQKQLAGNLEFWDIDNMDLLGTAEHFMLTDVAWDPSGRYISTLVSYYRHQSENGYIIWNVLGRVHYKFKNEKVWQFLWRPRPPSPLTEEEENRIKKTLSERKKQIIEETRAAEQKAAEEILQERQKKWDEFQQFLKRIREEYNSYSEKRKRITGVSEEFVEESEEEVIEEIIEELKE